MVGFGYSDRPEDVEYGLQTWADQTLGVMDALGIEKAHLVGNSFGGSIALRIATKHPDRVDKLVLMGSMGVHFQITEGLDKVWGYDGTLEDMRTVLDYFAYSRDAGQRGTRPGALRRRSNEPGFQESFSSMFPAPRQRWVEAMATPDEEIRKPAAPHADRARPRGQGHPGGELLQAEELLDNADLSVFSHCGHWSMIERTADFNRLVRDFFLGSTTG